jgi:beta-galactosidase
VTCAICKVWDDEHTWEDTDSVFAALDIGGYNYAWDLYESDHERHPDRLMMGTESFPLEALENWQQVEEHSYVIGDFVWTSLDYLGESGIGRQHYDGEKVGFLGEYPWHQAYCGDLDLCGFKRPQSYYRDMVWGDDAKVYIAVHCPVPEGKTASVTRWGWPDVAANWTWSDREGQTFQVDVYSNCEWVELLLNGKSIGIKPTTRAEKLMATFEIPYQPGKLKAVGYIGDTQAAEMVIETTGAPAAIRLIPDRDAIPAAIDSLVFVTVEVVDAEGRLQPNADNEVFFTTHGQGHIAALGSGDPMNTERYRGNQHTAYHGRCLVAVHSNGKRGEIRLRAQADGLQGAEVVIVSHKVQGKSG